MSSLLMLSTSGLGKPVQGQSSAELHHDGQSHRKRQREGLAGLAETENSDARENAEGLGKKVSEDAREEAEMLGKKVPGDH
jgi:hypothetical protein